MPLDTRKCSMCLGTGRIVRSLSVKHAGEPCRCRLGMALRRLIVALRNHAPALLAAAERLAVLEESEGLVFENMAEHCDAATADLRERLAAAERVVEAAREFLDSTDARPVVLGDGQDVLWDALTDALDAYDATHPQEPGDE